MQIVGSALLIYILVSCCCSADVTAILEYVPRETVPAYAERTKWVALAT